jgi:alcohol dehydrogenase class IV
VRFGRGAIDEAPARLAERGFDSYALLTTERAANVAPALAESATAVLYVPDGPVPEAAAEVRSGVGGRPVVALGGGRVIDAAKAIAGADGLRCAAIPTTLSGAEMTPFHRMPAGAEGGSLVRPSLVINDPALAASQPMPGLAASAMNALAHALEALYTPFASPVTDMAALRAAELIAGFEQEDLALGALLAGYASGAAGFAVHHVVCQTLVREAGTPHAQSYAVMLPHFVELMADRAPDAVKAFREAVGDVSELAARSGVTKLSDLGVGEKDLPRVVEAAAGRGELFHNTPNAPTPAELHALLRRAL